MWKPLVMAITYCLLASFSSLSDEHKAVTPKEPPYRSEHPLYFRLAFGPNQERSMLGVLDEAEGTGKGYNVAYVDENMNNDLTDDVPKKPLRKEGSLSGRFGNSAEFEIAGPLGEKESGVYTVYLLMMHPSPPSPPGTKGASAAVQSASLWWSLKAGGWNYMFINGVAEFYSTASEAVKGKPILLAGGCKWEVASRTENERIVVSAGLKDENGCTLRILSGPHGNPVPALTLTKDDQKIFEQKMAFG
jgi:hypothetical protein